jgi:hypothetical protein
MPERNYPPAYLRYLKARLSNFLRPSFWGTGIFLLVVGIVIRAYWLNPALFTQNQNKEADKELVTQENVKETSLSDEDKAIRADIDNMPTLLSDFDQANLLNTTTTYESKNQDKSSNNLLEDVIIKENTAVIEPKSKSGLQIVNPDYSASMKNPFVVQAENLLQSDQGNNINQVVNINNLAGSPEKTAVTTGSNLGVGLTNQTTNNQSIVVISPLAAAIKQSSNANPINYLGSNGRVSPILPANGLPNVNPINPLGSNGQVSPILPANGFPNQSLSSGSIRSYIQQQVRTQPPQKSYGNFNGVQTAPNVEISTTGVSPVINSSYPVQVPSPGAVNSNTPVEYGTYGNYSVQQPSQLPQSNLSYPGQVQGQYSNGYQR